MTAPHVERSDAAAKARSTGEWTRIASGGALNIGGAGVAAAVNVLLVLVVTRQTTPTRAGSLFAATSVFLIAATVARLGTTTGLVYWVARLRALGQSADVNRCVRIALVPVGCVGLLAGAALFACAEPLGELVGRDEPGFLVDYLRGLAIFLPAAALADALQSVTRGLGLMRPTVTIDKVMRPGLQLLATVAVLAVAAPEWLAVAWAGPYVLAALVAAGWARVLMRRRRGGEGEPVGDPSAPAAAPAAFGPGPFWRYTLPRAVSTLVQLGLQRLDIVLVAALRGPADAAVYTAATRFLVVGQLGSSAIATAVQPRISALLARDNRQEAGRVYQVASAWVVLCTWPVYLLSLSFAEELVSVFGPGYDAGARVVVVLCLVMLVATACGMVDTMLNMAGRTSWTLLNSVAALTTMIVLDLVLIPRYGIVGAALGWSAAILVNNLLPLGQLFHAYGLHPFGPEERRAMLLGGALLGVPGLVLAAAAAPDGVRAAVIGACLAAYPALVWRLRHPLGLDAFLLLRRGRSSRRQQPAVPAAPSVRTGEGR